MDKKTVLITGASSGIGKDLAFIYAKNNYNLVLTARNLEKLNKVKKDLSDNYNTYVEVFIFDLSEQNSAEELYKIIIEKNIKINILINNAGYGLNGNFIDLDIKSQINMMNLNMISLTNLTYLFIKDMQKQNFGHVVNIASTAAFQPIAGFAVYAATKAYVLHFSEAIAEELKNTNINITAICPGATESNFMNNAGVKKVKFVGMASSKELAEFTFNSVKNNKVVAVHGFINSILSFSIRFTPRFIVRIISGKFFD